MFKKELTSEAIFDTNEEEVKTVAEHKYWQVNVTMLGGGQYKNELIWTFGYDNPSSTAKDSACNFANSIMGDGTGIWKNDDSTTIIKRDKIVCVNVTERIKLR